MSQSKDEKEKEQPAGHALLDALATGAELAGGAAGGALGVLASGPLTGGVLAVGGVLISKALVAAGNEICSRVLSSRERARVGAALSVSASRTKELLEEGKLPRDDGFLSDGTDRPPVEEVTEGLLLAAQRAYDEKKVIYIGKLSANVNFRSDIDVRAASVLVRLAGDLSYQQLCLLRLGNESELSKRIVGGKYQGRFKDNAHAAVLADFLDLERRGFLSNGTAVLGLTDLDPPIMKVQGYGLLLFELMELKDIPEGDLAPLREVLNKPNPVHYQGEGVNPLGPVQISAKQTSGLVRVAKSIDDLGAG